MWGLKVGEGTQRRECNKIKAICWYTCQLITPNYCHLSIVTTRASSLVWLLVSPLSLGRRTAPTFIH